MTRPLARFGIVPMTKLLALGGHGIGSEILDQGLRVLDRVATGTVYINNYFNAAAQSPEGGYKQFGCGWENGWERMRYFMQAKFFWLSTSPGQPAPF